jgi:hypothetical protein
LNKLLSTYNLYIMPFDSNNNSYNTDDSQHTQMSVQMPTTHSHFGYRPYRVTEALEQASKQVGGSFAPMPRPGRFPGQPIDPHYRRQPIRNRLNVESDDDDDDSYDSTGELTGNGIKKISRKLRKWSKRFGKESAEDSDSDSNSDDFDDDDELTGQGIRKLFKRASKKIKKSTHEVGKIAKQGSKAVVVGATKSGNAISHSATDKNGIIRGVTSAVLDETPMVIGKLAELGVEAGVTAYTGNPVAGKLAGKVSGNLVKKGADVGRDKLEEKTGYGSVNLTKVVEKYVKNNKPTKEVKEKVKREKKPNPRNDIVKAVMQEKNLSMIEASSYVKANGLYTK